MVAALRTMNTASVEEEQQQHRQRFLRAGSVWFGMRLTQALVQHLDSSSVMEQVVKPASQRQERKEVVLPVYRAVPPLAQLVPPSKKHTKTRMLQ